ncbi:unnamed protein product [Schistosoma mattheei]|uniref:Uncharacterized protein n=1 Tax=Schistosoma mattheei TaxID=31246 RepID=A0A183NDS8_9TREM|nr:unnamed protein product [Schistosoma mattheei]
MKDSVDAQLRKQQAGFRKYISCAHQIATLLIIVEQSIEWISSLYINTIDYEKLFDTMDRKLLWRLLRHYGVPQKIVSIIQNSYDGLNYKNRAWKKIDKLFQGKDWCQARLLTLTLSLSPGDRLDHEYVNI